MTTGLRQDIVAFGQRLQEHTKALTAANALLVRRASAASLRKYPTATAPAPAAMTPEEREAHYRAECERRGVQYVALPEGGDDR